MPPRTPKPALEGGRGRLVTMSDIAEAAGVSTGNVYHHFPDKEALFLTLLDQYWTAIEDPELPFNKVLAVGSFPDNLEEVGHASRQLVDVYRRYVELIYVDVVEFEGSHIRKFYADMAKRYADFLDGHDGGLRLAFTLYPPEQLAEAASRLGETIEAALGA